MVELAIAGNPAFAMSEIELRREGPSYTVDTLAELADEAARQEWRGTSTSSSRSRLLTGFGGWREPARLLALARLAVRAAARAPLPDATQLAALLPGRSGVRRPGRMR